MMITRPVLAAAFIGALFMPAAAQDAEPTQNYFCAASHGTGFGFREGRWQQFNGNVDELRYFVEAGPVEFMGKSGTHHVRELGQGGLEYRLCTSTAFRIRCSSYPFDFSSFEMDTENLRFQMIYTWGYLEGEDTGDTPHFVIGTCSPVS